MINKKNYKKLHLVNSFANIRTGIQSAGLKSASIVKRLQLPDQIPDFRKE